VPEVLSVGGTTLKASTSASRGYTESVWEGSTSGCSTEFAKPAYQDGLSMGSCTMRADVDVAAPGSGVSVYQGGWENGVGGTSCASPFVAGLLTHVGLAGAPNDFFYAHASAFFDVTAGTNDSQSKCTGVMCNAGAGWDGPSGLGSPNAAALVDLDAGLEFLTDAGSPDATLPTDGGAAASEDGGEGTLTGDGGSGLGPLADGGTAGSGTPATGDASTGNGATGAGSSGCSCRATGASSPTPAPAGVALAILGAVFAVRRRKRA
jgi:MYXO-CTERM domain-containing protein